MKKLMIAAAIVCAAAMSQAASLQWKSTGFYWDSAKNEKATSITGGSVVLCLINDGEDWSKGVTVLDTGVLSTGSMPAQVGKVQGSATGGTFDWSYDSGKLKNGDVLTVLFMEGSGTDAKFSQLAYVGTDGKPTSSLVTDTYVMSGLSDDKSTLTAFSFAANGNITAQAVPEPTSGLLLLLGIGAMALRRRRA